MNEDIGIFAELHARRVKYGRFAYRAPTFREPMPALRAIERPKPTPRPKVYPPTRPFKRILASVCNAWGVTEHELLGPHRTTRLCHPRFAVCRIARDRLGWSLPQIGYAIRRDHTSVLHALGRVRELHRHHRDWRNRYSAALIELRGGVL